MASGFTYNPYGSSKKSVYNPFPSTTGSMTPLQAVEAAYLARQGKHQSMLSRLFHSVGHGLETGLAAVAAPSHAIAGGVLDATHGDKNDFDFGRFLHGFKQGITMKEHKGFGEVLSEHSNYFRHHHTLAGLAGLGLDIGTDPTLLLGFGAVAGAEHLTALAARETAAGLEKGAISTAEKVALRGPKTLTEARHSFDTLNKAGDGFDARKALAAKNLELFQLKKEFPEISVEQLTPHMDQRAGLQAMAEMERTSDVAKRVAMTYKIPFAKESGRFLDRGRIVVRTPLKPPTLKAIATQEAWLGRLPLSAPIAEQIGRALKPEWDNPKFHALENVAKRTTEHLDKDYMDNLSTHLGAFISGDKKLSEEQMLDALDVGETTKRIVDPQTRLINKSRLAALVRVNKLTPVQAEFLSKWHDYTEYLRLQDLRYGRAYDKKLSPHLKEGSIYVPHMYTKNGSPITPQYGSSVLVKPGYEYSRLSKGLQSVKMMKELHKDGVYRNEVETNPVKLMVIRARRGAQAHSDAMLRDIIAKSYGVPKWVADTTKLSKLADEQEQLMKRLDNLHLHNDPNAAWSNIAKNATTARKKMAANDRRAHTLQGKKIKAKISSLEEEIKGHIGEAVPTASKLMAMSGSAWKLHSAEAGSHGGKFYGRVGTRSRSRYQAANKAEQRMKRLVPKTGEKVHGSNHKGILRDLIAETEPKLLRGGKSRESERQVVIDARKDWTSLKAAMEKPLQQITTGSGPEAKRNWESWESRLKTAISLTKSNSLKEWSSFVKHEGITRADPLLKAQLANQKKALVSHEARRDAIGTKHYEGLTKDLERAQKPFEKRVGAERVKAGRANKRLGTLERLVEHHQSSKLNSAVPHGYVENTRLRHPVNNSSMMIPPEMDVALRRVKDALENDQFLADFATTWRQLTGRWKVMATVVNPGYRIRNTMSDMWNMYLRGVPLWAMGRYGAKAADMVFNDFKKGRNIELFLEAYDHGIFSGLFQGDIEKVSRFLKSGQAEKSTLAKKGKFASLYAKVATDFNRDAENWGRLTHYLYRRDYLQESASEAASNVRAAHFDYEDLTKTERSIKGKYIPFWTWTRKNIPYQITSYLSAPGKYATFNKMSTESEFAAGPGDKNQIVPSWISSQFAFRVPFGGKGNYFIPQFGPTDLSKLANPGQALGMLHPAIKTGVELATNKSLLTGAPIYGKELAHPRVPITGSPVADILKLIPGSNIGTTARRRGQGMIRGEGASPLLSYAAQQTPVSNLAVNQFSNIRSAQRGGDNKQLLSYVLGVSTYAPDQEQQLGIATQEEQVAFRQFLRGLRDEGKLPESKRKKSQFQKDREGLVKQAYANG